MKLLKHLRQILLLSPRYERSARRFYRQLVSASRQPSFYENWGVADTVDGRFDLISFHVCSAMIWLSHTEHRHRHLFIQDLFDVMFEDMDYNLREMGVGDLSVKKRMRDLWNAFNGRRDVYFGAFPSKNLVPHKEKLIQAISKNIYRGKKLSAQSQKFWVSYSQDFIKNLNKLKIEDVLAGKGDLI